MSNDKDKKLKTREDTSRYVEMIAKKNKWILTKDKNMLFMLVDGLMDYFNNVSYYNCPCRDSQRNAVNDRDIICPCVYADKDIEEYGRCYCALYFDPNYDFFKNKKISMIPERRLKK